MKQKSAKREQQRLNLHITRLFPNMVTLLALCAGLSAIRAALFERWELAVGFIVLAAVLDAIDGRIARMLHSTSEFGAQLDSLADIINFGVAPPLILYLWATYEVKGFGWALVLFFAICCALRLARFNTGLVTTKQTLPDRYFVGIPAPAGALLLLLPMCAVFSFGNAFLDNFYVSGANYLPHAIILFGALIGAGMASRLPTYSLKKVTIRREWVAAFMLGFTLLLIGLALETWLTVCILGLIYIITIPVGVVHYVVQKK